MSNKQSIKLYTEEQIRNAMRADFIVDEEIDNLINKLTPIELPSDEEIDEMGKDVIIYNDTKKGWFVEGLKFMRDQIQGGNK